MKKQNLFAIIGTLAIVANLLIPGLAFGQGTQGQGGTQVIGCGTLTLHVHGGMTPDINFSMDALQVSTATQYTYGHTIGGVDSHSYQDTTQILPAQAFIYVDDQRTNGSGCTGGAPTFILNVSAQSGGFTNGSATIPNSYLKVATTTNVTTWNFAGSPEWTEYGTDGEASNFIGNTTLSSPSDVLTSHPVADAADLTAPGTFTADLGTLDSATLLHSTVNVVGEAGIGVAWNLTVPPNQQAGTYTNTITYDLAAPIG